MPHPTYTVEHIPAHHEQVSLLLDAPRIEHVDEHWRVRRDGELMVPRFRARAAADAYAEQQRQHWRDSDAGAEWD